MIAFSPQFLGMELPSSDEEKSIVGVTLPDRMPDTRYRWPYGAASIAAEYCGRSWHLPPPLGEWQHGWHPAYQNVHPELVVGSTGMSTRSKEWKYFWVARNDQAEFLRSQGYKRVEAIGLPILYVSTAEISRVPRSLLVMPVHSLENTSHSWGFDEYADAIDQIRNHFSQVVVCVHPVCFKRGYWVEAFRSRGIAVVSGAEKGERRSLERMAALFSRFEYMTTNGFGSHLAYAAYFGAKPSIFGPFPRSSAEDFKDDGIYKECPDLIPIVSEMGSEESLRIQHAELFRKPWEAESRKEWAAHELGLDCRRSPAQLKRLFGWDGWGVTKFIARRLKRSAKQLLVGSE